MSLHLDAVCFKRSQTDVTVTGSTSLTRVNLATGGPKPSAAGHQRRLDRSYQRRLEKMGHAAQQRQKSHRDSGHQCAGYREQRQEERPMSGVGVASAPERVL